MENVSWPDGSVGCQSQQRLLDPLLPPGVCIIWQQQKKYLRGFGCSLGATLTLWLGQKNVSFLERNRTCEYIWNWLKGLFSFNTKELEAVRKLPGAKTLFRDLFFCQKSTPTLAILGGRFDLFKVKMFTKKRQPKFDAGSRNIHRLFFTRSYFIISN